VGRGQIHHLKPNPRRLCGSGSIRSSPTGKQRRAFVLHGDLLGLEPAHGCRLRTGLARSSQSALGAHMRNAARTLATAAFIAALNSTLKALEFGTAIAARSISQPRASRPKAPPRRQRLGHSPLAARRALAAAWLGNGDFVACYNHDWQYQGSAFRFEAPRPPRASQTKWPTTGVIPRVGALRLAHRQIKRRQPRLGNLADRGERARFGRKRSRRLWQPQKKCVCQSRYARIRTSANLDRRIQDARH
jgi:hypothetical protein